MLSPASFPVMKGRNWLGVSGRDTFSLVDLGILSVRLNDVFKNMEGKTMEGETYSF